MLWLQLALMCPSHRPVFSVCERLSNTSTRLYGMVTVKTQLLLSNLSSIPISWVADGGRAVHFATDRGAGS